LRCGQRHHHASKRSRRHCQKSTEAVNSNCCLTSQLSGTRPRKSNRNYLIQIHRLPPMINEDEVACPLQRMLEHRTIGSTWEKRHYQGDRQADRCEMKDFYNPGRRVARQSVFGQPTTDNVQTWWHTHRDTQSEYMCFRKPRQTECNRYGRE
jgi:hypothetical protein